MSEHWASEQESAQSARPASVAERLTGLTGVRVEQLSLTGGSHGARHYRARLAGGGELFVKESAGGTGQAALAAEVRGLEWLAEVDAVRVPQVVCAGDGLMALQWLAEASPRREDAERFGRELARLHQAGPASFGAPWPGFIASLELPNDEARTWPRWYAENRILPYCRLGRNRGSLSAGDVTVIEEVASRIEDLAGPDEPPSRLHGDLWSGNVLWSGGQGWVVDPAAHGGHRETDLAMLMLFGAPYLERILAAYREATPLAAGWQARVPLHQLHPLLVHVCLFGGGYRESALDAARRALH